MNLFRATLSSTLAGILALSLAACGGSATETGENPAKAAEQATDAQAADMAEAGQLTSVQEESMVENAAKTEAAQEAHEDAHDTTGHEGPAGTTHQ